jgi:hypothetical protein
MNKNPYMQVVDMPRMMGGVGAPRSTVFGAIGRTRMDPYAKSLGGLIEKTTLGNMPRVTMPASQAPLNSDHHIIGPAAKTRVPGHHYGQVPYPGVFRSHLGARV